MAPRIDWLFTNLRTSSAFRTDVLSATVNFGRQTYMDVYNGGGLTFTIKNQNNQAAGFQMNDKIRLQNGTTYTVVYYVDEVQFNDYEGNTGLSTATIICSDAIARLGRSLVDKSLTQTNTTAQAVQLNETGVDPTIYAVSAGDSIASAVLFEGAPMQRLNQLVSTERGRLACFDTGVYFWGRESVSAAGFSGVGLSRTASASTIGYQEFSRTALGLNFMNNVTVTPTGGAEQVAQNASSVALYGSNYYSVSSEDATNVQALGLAQWIANSQSDPNALRYEIGFTDRANDIINVNTVLGIMAYTGLFELTWRVPGSPFLSIDQVVTEGFSMNITPSETSVRLFLSPLTLYQFFTLDSFYFGRLSKSRLGW
jgi:hypothetical protein